jgi:hypothetical protein
MEWLRRIKRTDGNVVAVKITERNLRFLDCPSDHAGSKAPVLGFTCGSSSSWLTSARALGKAMSKLSTLKNKSRPLPGLAEWGLVNEGCSWAPRQHVEHRVVALERRGLGVLRPIRLGVFGDLRRRQLPRPVELSSDNDVEVSRIWSLPRYAPPTRRTLQKHIPNLQTKRPNGKRTFIKVTVRLNFCITLQPRKPFFTISLVQLTRQVYRAGNSINHVRPLTVSCVPTAGISDRRADNQYAGVIG